MLGIGAIEIEYATYSLGMCGSIVISINRTGKRYRINHTMLNGYRVSEYAGKAWADGICMDLDDFIKLLPEGRGWDTKSFVFVWAGFAAGYEKGRVEGVDQERQRSRRADNANDC